MEINEAFRRIVVGHRWLILACAIVPMIVVGIMLVAAPSRFVASARIQQSSTALSTDTEANSVVNHVRGIATSPAVVGQALRVAGVRGHSAMAVGKHDVTITEFGSSPVLDLSVADRSPRVAQNLSNALARIVVNTLGGQQDARKRLLTTQMRAQQQQLYAQRQSVLLGLSQRNAPDRVASLSAQLTTLDQQLGDIASTLRQLALPDPTDGSAMFISPAQEALPVSRHGLTDLVLALLAGLVAGLLISSLIEVARPKVANAHAIARDLGVPFLGSVALPPPPGSVGTTASASGQDDVEAFGDTSSRVQLAPETLVAVRGAAARADADTIVIAECGRLDGMDGAPLAVSRRLRDAFADRVAQNGQVDADVSRSEPWSVDPAVAAAATDTGGPEREAVSVLEGDGRVSSGSVDVRSLSALQISDQVPRRGRALVALAAVPAPQHDIDRVIDLSAATGWPVLGVIELTRRPQASPTANAASTYSDRVWRRVIGASRHRLEALGVGRRSGGAS